MGGYDALVSFRKTPSAKITEKEKNKNKTKNDLGGKKKKRLRRASRNLMELRRRADTVS